MIKQRWSDQETPAGLLNISIKDIILDSTDEVKRNILKACNECSYSGYIEDIEFATLLDVETGIPLTDCHLLKGTQNGVDISDWDDIISNAEPLSLIIIHNHTIETPFSFDDIMTFMSHPALKSAILTVGTYAYYLEKNKESVCSFDLFLYDLRKRYSGQANFICFDGDWDIKALDEFMAKSFQMLGIAFRRWS